MSNTPPIERLNYFNGQRLEAADFRLEQDFHIRVRRLLTQALVTPGIAAGLHVDFFKPDPNLLEDRHKLVISEGLALDSRGREIILVKPSHPIPVSGRPTEPSDPVTGNYLVIEYAEEATTFVGDGCAVRLGVTCKANEDLAWGAPSRIRSETRIYIQHEWPKTEDNKIVLAQLELKNDCSVRSIRTFVRKYVAAAKKAKARALALEGEKDIDKDNPKELYFHLAGGMPESAKLYLRASQFSTLYYTELGIHTHALEATTGPVTKKLQHSHKLAKDIETEDSGIHTHDYHVDDGAATGGFDLEDEQVASRINQDKSAIIDSKPHHHAIKKENVELDKGTYDDGVGVWMHWHSVSEPEPAGVPGAPLIRTTAALTYVDDLRIKLDGADITALVLAHLHDRDEPDVDPPVIWKTLGDGTGGHKLAAKDASGNVEGTGEIDLLILGVDLAPEKEHRLTFSVPDGGGQIQYNLYIE